MKRITIIILILVLLGLITIGSIFLLQREKTTLQSRTGLTLEGHALDGLGNPVRGFAATTEQSVMIGTGGSFQLTGLKPGMHLLTIFDEQGQELVNDDQEFGQVYVSDQSGVKNRIVLKNLRPAQP